MVTQKQLKKWLDYNPDTGVFTWKMDKGTARKGDIAGWVNKLGYIRMCLDNKFYYAHRLAWLYVYGYWPNQIDHIDRNPTNNRLENLRDSNYSENGFNRGMWATNTSGHKGVYWHKTQKKWTAYVRIDKKSKHLGTFVTKEEAIAARQQAL